MEKVSHYPPSLSSPSLSTVSSKTAERCGGGQEVKDTVALVTSLFLEKWEARPFDESDREEVGQEPEKSGEVSKMFWGNQEEAGGPEVQLGREYCLYCSHGRPSPSLRKAGRRRLGLPGTNDGRTRGLGS